MDLEKIGTNREFIQAAEKELLGMEQVTMEPTHYQARDLYGREITIPAGVILVGKIHKHSSLNILLKGKMSIMTEDGVKDIEGPYTVVSKPGIKRMGFAHTESTWLCVHGTQETDLEMIEKDVIANNYAEVEYSKEEISFLESVKVEVL